MSRKVKLIIGAISGLFIFFLYASHKFSSPTYTTEYFKSSREYIKSPQNSIKQSNSNRDHLYMRLYYSSGSSNGINNNGPPFIGVGGGGGVQQQAQFTTQNTTVTIEDILTEQRDKIQEDMLYFEYPGGRFGVDAEKLSDLTIETNGSPVRSIIITTWRSGSTFLGDILNAMPANFYHYEPLLNYDIIQIRGPPYDQQAIQNLKNLLRCNYTDMAEYLNYGQQHTYLFSHNTRLWRQCRLYSQFCWEPKFLSAYCKLFPLQSMKVVRLRLSIAEQLLADER